MAELVGDDVEVGPVEEELEPDGPRSVPAAISGVSPTELDWFSSQRFPLVISRRAHWGTAVPAGIGLGNWPGGSTLEQLVTNCDQVIQVCP